MVSRRYSARRCNSARRAGAREERQSYDLSEGKQVCVSNLARFEISMASDDHVERVFTYVSRAVVEKTMGGLLEKESTAQVRVLKREGGVAVAKKNCVLLARV